MARGQRRSLVSTVSLLVGALILGAMVVVGYRNLTAPVDTAPEAKKTAGCAPGEKEVAKKFLKRREVKVSVFNAGGATGQAGRTLAELEKAGFRPGEVANAPSDMSVPNAVVYSTRENDPAAKLVARFMGKHVPVKLSEEEYGPGVDVFVGKGHTKFNRKAQRRIRLEDADITCVPPPS